MQSESVRSKEAAASNAFCHSHRGALHGDAHGDDPHEHVGLSEVPMMRRIELQQQWANGQ